MPEPMSEASGMIATQPISSSCLREDRIVGAVDHHLEAVLHQRFRGFQRFRHVRKQRVRVAQHLELHQVVCASVEATRAPGAACARHLRRCSSRRCSAG